MADKIYEYKDKENWFLGEWGGFNAISGLGNVCGDDLYELSQQVAKLVASKCCGKCHGHGEGGCHKDEFTATTSLLLKNHLIFN